MATTVQNSDKKYLNFDGLAYYDGKLKKWIGDNYAPITGGADATESMRLWNEFLAESDKTADGKLQALPTLKSLNDFKLDMDGDPTSTDNNEKIGRVGVLEATVSDYATVKSNAANSYSLWEGFLKDLTVTDNNPAPTLKTIDDELFMVLGETKTSKLSQIVGSIGTSVISYGSTNPDSKFDGLGLVYKAANNISIKKQAENFANKIGNDGSSVLTNYGRLGLAEANLSFAMGTLIDFKENVIGAASDCQDIQYEKGVVGLNTENVLPISGRLGLTERFIGNINTVLYGDSLGTSVCNDTCLVYKMNDLYGDDNSVDYEKSLGRVGVLEKQISGLTGAVHFKGATAILPDPSEPGYADGDIIVIAGATATPNLNGKEYILSGGSWVELGDTTQELARIGELEKTVNGDGSNTGLVDIVGDANSGLVKDVNDIKTNYVSKSEIVFATTAEIDTLFATA